MASGPDSTQVPLPEDDNDFDLFGPADTAGAGGTGQPQQPVPPGPAQQPPVAPAVQQVTVGLDPAMQQMMLQMMQSQQTMLEMLNKRMDAEEKRRKDQEASQAAVVNPFGPGWKSDPWGRIWKWVCTCGERPFGIRCWEQPS